MSTQLIPHVPTRLEPGGDAIPPVPWRDPYSVSPSDLAAYIRRLEAACIAYPQSADLRTCLGMAHAVNYDVYKSLDALEEARAIDPEDFWAQLKFAELHYRLRALNRAEEETRHAAQLASTPYQLMLARKQMQEIRQLKHSAIRNVEWVKPLLPPVLALAGMMTAVFVFMMWK